MGDLRKNFFKKNKKSYPEPNKYDKIIRFILHVHLRGYP